MEERDLGFIQGFFLGQFVEDIFVAFGFVDLVDNFEADFIDIFGVRLPVLQRISVFGYDDFVKNFFVHIGGIGKKNIRVKLYYVSKVMKCEYENVNGKF